MAKQPQRHVPLSTPLIRLLSPKQHPTLPLYLPRYISDICPPTRGQSNREAAGEAIARVIEAMESFYTEAAKAGVGQLGTYPPGWGTALRLIVDNDREFQSPKGTCLQKAWTKMFQGLYMSTMSFRFCNRKAHRDFLDSPYLSPAMFFEPDHDLEVYGPLDTATLRGHLFIQARRVFSASCTPLEYMEAVLNIAVHKNLPLGVADRWTQYKSYLAIMEELNNEVRP